MMGVARILTPDGRRLVERDLVLSTLAQLTVSETELSADAAADLWQVLRRRAEQLLADADAAVTTRVALEVHDARINRHVQTHRGCVMRADCATYRALQRMRGRLQREADRDLRKLLGGSR